MNRLHFLVISSDQPFQDRLTKALGNDFNFTCVCGGEEVRQALLERKPDALLINPRERIPADEDPLRIARGIYPRIPAALITTTDTSACFQTPAHLWPWFRAAVQSGTAAQSATLLFETHGKTGIALGFGFVSRTQCLPDLGQCNRVGRTYRPV